MFISKMSFTFNIKPMSYYAYMKQNRFRKYISKDGKQYVKIIREQLELQMKTQNLSVSTEKCELYINFFFDNKRKNDLDNMVKPLLDAITGILFEDDKLIYKLVICKKDGLKYNKIVITHLPLSIEKPQFMDMAGALKK